ncbi:MAG: hypothetical protein FD156_2203 [Nitrospirae bacterium]|nr:MAG: hypothetical protein FD156_2203 [Nitrospirota bacterium]
MKNIKGIILLAILIISFTTVNVFAKNVSFTQDDRDRLIRVEARLDEGIKAVNQRIDDVKGEIQALRELVYVVVAGIFVLIGFVIWDRRTALAPAIRKNKELEEREERLEKALREYAKKEPGLADILKNLGLM